SAVILSLGMLLSAQHGVAAKFDPTKPTTLKGVVTQVDWANPFVHIIVKVPAASGSPVRWAVELESPILLARNGWSETTVQPGDSVTVQGFLARNGTRQVSGNSVLLAKTNKNVLVGYNGTAPARRTAAAAPAPKWPDGHP